MDFEDFELGLIGSTLKMRRNTEKRMSRGDITDAERRRVLLDSSYGVPVEHTAMALGLSPSVYSKYFKEEIDFGRSQANRTVAQALYKKCLAGDINAIKYWLNCRANWQEKQAITVEHTLSPVSELVSALKADIEAVEALPIALEAAPVSDVVIDDDWYVPEQQP